MKRKINLEYGCFKYEWNNKKNEILVTCWKRITYEEEKPILLRKKSQENENDNGSLEERSRGEYEEDTIEEKKSCMVIGDTDDSPIVEIRNNYISIEGEDKLKKRYKQIKEDMKMGKCKEVISEMEILKCLVDNLEEELGILAALDGINELETEQRIQVENLIKTNEEIFAKGLIQLGRTKEEMHKIVLKEEAEPIKQRPYQVAHTENEFIIKEVELEV
ncbi:hypothetical protein F8M41_019830 [Gigaspora margarita]|uniref:Uncharacterized protein n=1 Tax=Gigaspora margarita TaxID=4874 RepID=A0A8H4AJB6_GIGMA|nr:hypothetical protein F8M41_019830 [Gigaspora margarita]